MKPFLLLSTRAEDPAAHGELEMVRHFGGLRNGEVIQHRLEDAPLPPLKLTDFSGIILGGGPFNASDEQKSEVQLRVEADLRRVVDDVIEHSYPFLGMCYGIGTVTSLLGGLVDRTYGENVGAIDVTLTESGAADPLLEGVPRTFRAFVGHKEAVTRLPETGVLLATGEACPVQMFRVGAHCYVTQFHPELDADGLASRIRVYLNYGYFDPADADKLMREGYEAGVGEEASLVLRNFTRMFGHA